VNQSFYDLQADGDFWGKLEEEWYNLARYSVYRHLPHAFTFFGTFSHNFYFSSYFSHNESTAYVVGFYRDNIDDHPWLAEYTAEKVCISR
jgi:hypothetical protein